MLPVPIVAVKVTGTPTLNGVPLAGDVSTSARVDGVMWAPVPIKAIVGVPVAELLTSDRSSSALSSDT